MSGATWRWQSSKAYFVVVVVVSSAIAGLADPRASADELARAAAAMSCSGPAYLWRAIPLSVVAIPSGYRAHSHPLQVAVDRRAARYFDLGLEYNWLDRYLASLNLLLRAGRKW